jgi:hypothetical protein
MMLDPEATREKNAEHAKKMGIDPDVVAKRWVLEAKSRVTGVARPPGWVGRQREGSAASPPGTYYSLPSPESMEASSPDAAAEGVASPEDVSSPNTDALMSPTESSSSGALVWGASQANAKRIAHAPVASTRQLKLSVQSSSTKRKRTTEEEPHVKGEPARKKSSVAKIRKKSVSKSVSPATDIATESSKTGAAREAPEDCTAPLFVDPVNKYPTLDLPKWYLDIGLLSRPMNELSKRRPQELTALEALRKCIDRCEGKLKPLKLEERSKLFDELRNHVHKAEFLLNITKFVVRKTLILVLDKGLPRIFGEEANFPQDLKADAYQLYLRWMRGDFLQNVLRGIITTKGGDRTSDKLDQEYKTKHPTTARFYGDEGLVLGQCWPTQLCTVRDGAHGSSQGGIFGEKEKGAYSIVLSGGGYHDKDEGDVIEYSGTEGKNFTPTDATQHMITSAKLGNVIRVIRSHQLNKGNPYRPEHGLRYDGLYTVKSYVLVDNQKQIHRFRLERCENQQPIRCGGGASARPTVYEVSAYKQVKA